MNVKMFWVQKIIRYLLTAFGGWLVAEGIGTEVLVDELIGALTVVGTIGWSMIQSNNRIKKGEQTI